MDCIQFFFLSLSFLSFLFNRSSRSHISGSEQEQIESSVIQDSGMTGSGGSVVRCLLEEAMGDEEATSGASSPPEREHSPSSSER